jgi:hypothetical protein
MGAESRHLGNELRRTTTGVGRRRRPIDGQDEAAGWSSATRSSSWNKAVVRGRQDHPTRIGRHTAVGPHAHVNGAVRGEAVFLATGASVFPGAWIGAGAEVRINGVVHVNSVLADAAVVPIGWVAVGDPARILPPDQHEAIWLAGPAGAGLRGHYGIDSAPPVEQLAEITRVYAVLLGRHRQDRDLG